MPELECEAGYGCPARLQRGEVQPAPRQRQPLHLRVGGRHGPLSAHVVLLGDVDAVGLLGLRVEDLRMDLMQD